MKKLLLAVLLGLGCTSVLADTVTTKVYKGTAPDCEGSGICKVVTTSSPIREHGTFIGAWELSANAATVTLHIVGSNVDDLPEDVFDQLIGGTFVMDQPFTFPSDIGDQMGEGLVLTIPKGRYTVGRDGEGYHIRFMLEQ